MAMDNEKLWVVRRYRGTSTSTFVFRTRDAARKFVHDKTNDQRNRSTYTAPQRATWGPEA